MCNLGLSLRRHGRSTFEARRRRSRIAGERSPSGPSRLAVQLVQELDGFFDRGGKLTHCQQPPWIAGLRLCYLVQKFDKLTRNGMCLVAVLGVHANVVEEQQEAGNS